jgi:hypothetical protein
MPKTPDYTELAKLSKRDLVAEIERLAGDPATAPLVQGLDTNQTHANILKDLQGQLMAGPEAASSETAPSEAASQNAEGTEDKRAAFERLLTERPDAVLVPTRQAVVRIPHPERERETFELSALADLDMVYVDDLDQVRRKWREPVEEGATGAKKTPAIGTTAITDVPAWARETVYDLVAGGDLKVYINDEDAQAQAGKYTEPERIPILDVVTGPVSMSLVYGEKTGLAGQHRPILVEPRGQFDRVEQEVAWNVINSRVAGVPPIPANPDDLSGDLSDITHAEISHVRGRIETALATPERFTERQIPRAGNGAPMFQTRVFFNQLLECEYKGFTPQRGPKGNKNGGTRLGILNLIREMASDHGYDVIGDYVTPKAASELTDQSPAPVAETMSGIAPVASRAPYRSYQY